MGVNQGDLNVDIGARLNKFEKALARMHRDYEAASRNLQNQSQRTGRNIDNTLGSSLKRLGGIAAAAFSAERLVSFGYEATQLAGKLEGVETAFNRVADPSVLDALRKATRGTVTDLELMQQAVRASNFKIPLDQLGKLFEFATVRAQETGESVDYLVNSIISGIGRKSPLILDNLGISAVELRKRLRGVGVEAANVGDIAEIIGGIASEELKKAGDTAITTAQKTQKLRAEFINLQTQIGEDLTPAFNRLLTVTNSFLGVFAQSESEIKQFNVAWDLLNNNFKKTEQTAKLIEQGLKRQLTPLENAKILWRGFTDEQIKAAQAAKKTNDELKTSVEVYRDYLKQLESKEEVENSITSLGDLEGRLKNLQEQQKNATNTSYWKAYEAAIKKVTEQIKNLKGEISGLTDQQIKEQKALEKQLMLENELFDRGSVVGPEVQELRTDLMVEDLAANELAEANARANQFLEANKDIGAQLGQNQQLAASFSNQLANGFMNAAMAGENFGEVMSNMFVNLLQQLMQMIFQMLIFRGIMAALGIPVGGSVATAIGGSMFSGLGGIPGHAEGGITTGPHLALVGDNNSGKEAIIPFEKMDQFISKFAGGQSGNVTVTGKIKGSDIWLSNERAGIRRTRRR